MLFHHDPTRTDDQIDALLAHHRKNTNDLQLLAAAEGMEITLEKSGEQAVDTKAATGGR